MFVCDANLFSVRAFTRSCEKSRHGGMDGKVIPDLTTTTAQTPATAIIITPRDSTIPCQIPPGAIYTQHSTTTSMYTKHGAKDPTTKKHQLQKLRYAMLRSVR